MARFARIGLVMLAVASASGVTLAPAGAQRMQSRMELNGRTFALSAIELDRLTDLGRVVHTLNRGAQDRALDAARSVANSPDARYLLALYQLEIGRQRQDDALRTPALDVLIAASDTPREKLVGYLASRGQIAYRAGDYATASSAWTRLAELQPDDPQTLMNLAQVRAAQSDAAGAADLIRRAIAANRTGPPSEIWYRQWLSITYNARLADQTVAAGRALVTAYPTTENWRQALVAFRQLAAPQDGAEIDLLRLMRVARTLVHADEYQRLTQLLLRANLPAEAKAVLDEGVERGIVEGFAGPIPDIRREIDRALEPQRRRPPASADGMTTSFRLAVGLALAGRRPEAEEALRAIADNRSGGGRWYPDLAGFWLLWLARAG